MPGLSTDPTLGTGSVIGKYFGLVSTIPSTVLAVWVYLLFASGALSGPPSLATLRQNSPFSQPGYVAAAVGLALVLALMFHPVQFALVQLLEGYWGAGRLAQGVRRHLVLRQLDRRAQASRQRVAAFQKIEKLTGTDTGDISPFIGPSALRDARKTASAAVALQGEADAAHYVEVSYPTNPAHTMPTRLGNVLRRHEQLAGAAVHLPVLTWANHIGMAADPHRNEYLNDQRTQMDLSVRMAASMAAASVLTFGLLWPYGASALLTLIPLIATWLSYRGAVVMAESYGAALHAWVDLNRFRLYEELNLMPVASATDERVRNDNLKSMRLGQDSFDVALRQSPTDGVSSPATGPGRTGVVVGLGALAGAGTVAATRQVVRAIRARRGTLT